MLLPAKDKEGARFGGILKAVCSQIEALIECGVDVTLITASYPCAEKARGVGAEVYYSPGWHHAIKPIFDFNALSLVFKLRKHKIIKCILHHSSRTWAYGHLLFFGIPQIHIFHRERYKRYHYFRRFIALSPAYMQWLQKNYPLFGFRKVTWAPNGIWKLNIKKEWKPPKTPFRIGFIGRGGAGKGVDTLFEAAKQLADQEAYFELHFAGDCEEFIFQEAERYSLRSYTHHNGWLDDPTEFIDRIDLLVLPSIKEAFGLVLIEAMARNKPVLATKCNGPASFIKDGKTGYLTEIGNSTALANSIYNALNDINLGEVATAGRKYVEDHFFPAPLGNRLIEAFSELGVSINSNKSRALLKSHLK
jgi:glycosyltransferase involved in cell wall biosynthesis